LLSALLAALLATMLAALSGLLVLLAGPLAAALLLPGLLLTALLAFFRILRILVHRCLPWGPARNVNAPTQRSFRPRSRRGQDTGNGTSQILGKYES
jgi:hypothetical protein